jgi:hypothetical protein
MSCSVGGSSDCVLLATDVLHAANIQAKTKKMLKARFICK